MRAVVFPYVPYRGHPAPIIPIPIRVGPVELTAAIGLSPRLGIGFNLLGRQDVFMHFDVTFSDARAQVTFRPSRRIHEAQP